MIPEQSTRSCTGASPAEPFRLEACALRPIRVTVEITRGHDLGRRFRLEPKTDWRATLGKAEESDIRLMDPLVSTRHASLDCEHGRLRLTDLDSRHGTWVNGVRILGVYLIGGETIRSGDTDLKVTIENRAAFLHSNVDEPSVDESGSEVNDVVEELIRNGLPFREVRRRVLQMFERRYIEWILAKHSGNVSRAAAASGIARRYFYVVRARTGGQP